MMICLTLPSILSLWGHDGYPAFVGGDRHLSDECFLLGRFVCLRTTVPRGWNFL